MNRLRYLPEAETPDTSPHVFLSPDLQYDTSKKGCCFCIPNRRSSISAGPKRLHWMQHTAVNSPYLIEYYTTTALT